MKLNRCQAVTIYEDKKCRCDLSKNHKGDHAASQGIYYITWSHHNTVVMPTLYRDV